MSICYQCAGEVIWKRAPGKKPQCFELDGVTSHWDTCSTRRWAQTKATGQRFKGKQERESGERGKLRVTGYRGSVHGTKLDEITAPRITGDLYRKRIPCGRDAGECTQPPWEHCAKECPNRLRACQ